MSSPPPSGYQDGGGGAETALLAYASREFRQGCNATFVQRAKELKQIGKSAAWVVSRSVTRSVARSAGKSVAITVTIMAAGLVAEVA